SGTAGQLAVVMVAVIVAVSVLVVVVTTTDRADDLPGDVVAVLAGVEDTPAVVERVRTRGAEQAARRRVTVGDVDAGDLVVAVVLEARRALQARVDRRGRIAALGDDPEGTVRRVRIVLAHVEEPARIEGVAGGVEAIATVLH